MLFNVPYMHACVCTRTHIHAHAPTVTVSCLGEPSSPWNLQSLPSENLLSDVANGTHVTSGQSLYKLNAIRHPAESSGTTMALSLNSFWQWDFYYDEEISKVMEQSIPLGWPSSSKGPHVPLRRGSAPQQHLPSTLLPSESAR